MSFSRRAAAAAAATVSLAVVLASAGAAAPNRGAASSPSSSEAQTPLTKLTPKQRAAKLAAAKKAAARKARARRSLSVANGGFENGLAGWGGVNGRLSSVAGYGGGSGARVTASTRAAFSIAPNAKVVASTVAGTRYVGTAVARSGVAGRQLCLRVREWAGATVTGSAERCVTAGATWTRFADVSFTSSTSGRQIDLYVYRGSAAPKDSFDVDNIALAAVGSAPPPPAAEPLAPPTGLGSTDVTPTSLRVAWNASTDARVTSYRVSRDGNVLGTTGGTSFAVAGLSCGTASTYAVASVDAAGDLSTASVRSLSSGDCATPPPPPTPTAPSTNRLYSATSPLNTPIAGDAAVDPNSPVMVQQLIADTVPVGGWPIAVKEWTQPIYHATSATPRVDVTLTHTPYAGRKLSGVPIPAGARPDPAGDSTMVVIDRENGCEYDFQAIKQNADGSWTAHFGNTLLTSGTGIYPYSESPRAAGFGNAAGVITPEEMQAGRIDHALAFIMKNTKAGGPVLPATGSDGWSNLVGAIPEGARVQLDPSLDLDALGLEPWQKTIARALQVYGMYLIDTGGGFGLQAQNPISTSVPYPWGDKTYAYMPTPLVQHLRVLKLTPQFETIYRWVPNHCATLR